MLVQGRHQVGPGVGRLAALLERVQCRHPPGELAQGLPGLTHTIGSKGWGSRNPDAKDAPAVYKGQQSRGVGSGCLLRIEQNLGG